MQSREACTRRVSRRGHAAVASDAPDRSLLLLRIGFGEGDDAEASDSQVEPRTGGSSGSLSGLGVLEGDLPCSARMRM